MLFAYPMKVQLQRNQLAWAPESIVKASCHKVNHQRRLYYFWNL